MPAKSRAAPAASLTQVKIGRRQPVEAAPSEAPTRTAAVPSPTGKAGIEPAALDAPAPLQPAAPQIDEPRPDDGGVAGISRGTAPAEPAAAGAASQPEISDATQSVSPAESPKPEPAPRPRDLLAYWTQLKHGRRFPARADLDPEWIARHWPTSVLLTYRTPHQRSDREPLFSGAARFGGAGARASDLVWTPMVTDWILSVGCEAVRSGAPLQDIEDFRLPNGSVSYRITVLPLGDHAAEVDHVLCQLDRV